MTDNTACNQVQSPVQTNDTTDIATAGVVNILVWSAPTLAMEATVTVVCWRWWYCVSMNKLSSRV